MSSIDRSLLRSYPEIKDLLMQDADRKICEEIQEEQRSINGRTSLDDPLPRSRKSKRTSLDRRE